MTKLLISVQNASEAQLVLNANQSFQQQFGHAPVAILDVKDPSSGSLGRPQVKVVLEIMATLNSHRITSQIGSPEIETPELGVAFGELLNDRFESAREEWFVDPFQAKATGPSVPEPAFQGVGYWKIGLAHAKSLGNEWVGRWQESIVDFPLPGIPVAVSYLDWKTCESPSPEEVVDAAIANGNRFVLFDTYRKEQGNLFASTTIGELSEYIRVAKKGGLKTVVAGSVSISDLPIIVGEAVPNFIGVRGAVCAKERKGPLCDVRLAQLLNQFFVDN